MTSRTRFRFGLRAVSAAVGVGVCASLWFVTAASAQSEATYEAQHFTITFASNPDDLDAPELTDSDANGTPDSIERLGAALERARNFVVTELGYRPPPGEGPYPVYISRAQGDGFIRAAQGDSDVRASYVVIPPYLIRSENSDARVAALAVHEFFHGVQYGYDYDEDHWILEASAAWIEERLDDSADTPLFLLDDFVPSPERSLTSTQDRSEYGAFLFLQFLSERYDGGSPQVVRELWELMAAAEAFPGAPDLSSTEAVAFWLAGRDIGLSEAWNEFLLWRFQLSRFEDGVSYRAAMTQPWPYFQTDTKVSGETCRIPAGDERGGLSPLSGTYARFRPRLDGGGGATLTVVGPSGTTAFALLKPAGAPANVFSLSFDDAGVARTAIPFARASVRKLVVGVGNSSPTSAAAVAYSVIPAGADASAIRSSVPRLVQFGSSTRVSGSVSCNGAPAPFASVEVVETTTGGVSKLLHATSDSEGSWSIPVTPDETSSYSVRLADPLLSSAFAPEATLGVATFVTIAAPAQSRVGSPLEVSGTVSPAHAGAPMVLEYRRPARQTWLEGGTFELSMDSSYEQLFFPPGRGFWEVRVRMLSSGDDDHLPGTSLIETIEARP